MRSTCQASCRNASYNRLCLVRTSCLAARESLLLSCRSAGVLLSAEAARLRNLRAHAPVLDPALKQLIPPHICVTPPGEAWHSWLMTSGAPRRNENAFWAHASPRAQAPWWLKNLSETLMTWPLCSGNGYTYNCGCIGPHDNVSQDNVTSSAPLLRARPCMQ